MPPQRDHRRAGLERLPLLHIKRLDRAGSGAVHRTFHLHCLYDSDGFTRLDLRTRSDQQLPEAAAERRFDKIGKKMR